MNQRTIITILVFLFFLISVASTIFMTWKVDQIVVEGEVVGNVSITINQECGNNVCAVNENCAADASDCTDNICFEPTCTNGCEETAVANGGTDEACTGSTGCVGGDCQCDGSGNCVSGGAEEAGGGGGGEASGGGGTPLKADEGIKVLTEQIKSVTKVNEVLKQRLVIQNLGTNFVTIQVIEEGIDERIIIKKTYILAPGETKTITFEIFSNEAGVFTGKLVILAGEQRIEIPVIIEVETQQVLFDLSIDVKPKQLAPGEEISATITVFNINAIELANVNIDYFIKDLNNNIILQDSEIITMETQATLSKTFTLPEDIEEGGYVFIAQTSYQGTTGTTSESFIVKQPEVPAPLSKNPLVYTIITIIAIIIAIALLLNKKIGKITKIEKTIIRKPIIIKKTTKKIIDTKKLFRRQVLARKKKSLEEAFEKGYISRNAYLEGKKDLEKATRKLK